MTDLAQLGLKGTEKLKEFKGAADDPAKSADDFEGAAKTGQSYAFAFIAQGLKSIYGINDELAGALASAATLPSFAALNKAGRCERNRA